MTVAGRAWDAGRNLLETPIGQPEQVPALAAAVATGAERGRLVGAGTAQGNYDEAAAVTRMTLPRLGRVRSPRSVSLLADLATDLRRRRRNPTAADLLPEIETAVASHQQRG